MFKNFGKFILSEFDLIDEHVYSRTHFVSTLASRVQTIFQDIVICTCLSKELNLFGK